MCHKIKYFAKLMWKYFERLPISSCGRKSSPMLPINFVYKSYQFETRSNKNQITQPVEYFGGVNAIHISFLLISEINFLKFSSIQA